MTGVSLPLCRFCSRPWKPSPGVVASESYCGACSPERQAKAREAFAADGLVSVLRGKWLLRVKPSAVAPGDIARAAA